MFISNQLVYLDLQKTGSTHITNILSQILNGEKIGKHNRLPKKFLDYGQTIVGSVRNPWDWYVSLFGFGCDKGGGLYHRLTSPPKILGHGFRSNPVSAMVSLKHELTKPVKKWKNTYKNSNDPKLFREWLYMVFDSSNRYYLGERYVEASISSFVGFLTYRYLLLYSRDVDDLYLGSILNMDDLINFNNENNVLDQIIRNEHLEEDLINVLKYSGIRLNDDQRNKEIYIGRTNESSRRRELEYYYDQETAKLVNSREKFIVEKYDYQMPVC